MDSHQQHLQRFEMEVVDYYSEDSDSEIACVGVRISDGYRTNQGVVSARGVNWNRNIPSPEIEVIHQRNVYEPDIEVIEELQRSVVVPQRVLPANNFDIVPVVVELSDDDETEPMDNSFSSETTELVTPIKEPQLTDSLEVEDAENSGQPRRRSEDQDQSIGIGQEHMAEESSRIQTDQLAANPNLDRNKNEIRVDFSGFHRSPIGLPPTIQLKEETCDPDSMPLMESISTSTSPLMTAASKAFEIAGSSSKLGRTGSTKVSERASLSSLPGTAGPHIVSASSSCKPKFANQSKNQESVGTRWSPGSAGPGPSTTSGCTSSSEPSFSTNLEEALKLLSQIDFSSLRHESETETSEPDYDDDVKEFCARYKAAEAKMYRKMDEQKIKKLEAKKRKELEKENDTEKQNKDKGVPDSEPGTRSTRQSTSRSRLSRNSLASPEPTTSTQSPPSCSSNTSKSAKQFEGNNDESSSDDGDNVFDSDSSDDDALQSVPDEIKEDIHDNSSEDDSSGPDISVGRVSGHDWIVEAATDYRVLRNDLNQPVLEYRTKWKGWKSKFNSWVPGHDYASRAPIENFWHGVQKEADLLNRPIVVPVNQEEVKVRKNSYIVNESD